MSIGIRCAVAAAVLCGSVEGCKGPYCPKGYDQIDDTCYLRKDAGAPDAGDEKNDTSRVDANDADDDIEPETESDADAGQERADANNQRTDPGQEEADAGDEGEDASGISRGDPGTACVSSAEVCDGQDNDCDGRVDEEQQTWYCDADGDGFAASANGQLESCEKPAASASCSGWTTTAPSAANAQDCDDSTGRRFPVAGFGLAVGSNGDLNCDGDTETRLEFVATSVPGYYSSTTRFNICQQNSVAGAADDCDCWFSTAIGSGFVGYVNGGAVFDASGRSSPYFMRTFPCSEQPGDAIFLQRIAMINGECQQERGNVAVRQLCR